MECITEGFTECNAPLSDLHQLYIGGDLSKKEFEGMLFQYLLSRHEKFRVFNKNLDRWNDFISWLYPRLARAVELYKDLGSSFDAYINKLVNVAAKEYRCRETDRRIIEYTCWKARAEENILFESEPEYLEPKKEISIPEGIKPRQIIFLILKSYFSISEEFVKQVTKQMGISTSLVLGMIEELKKLRSRKDAEIFDLRERIHCQHYRCLTYQKQMTNTQPGTIYEEKLKIRLEKAKKRYISMKKRLEGMRMSASNRMIAELLGIPRGTIDSSLFAIRNRAASEFTENSTEDG